MKNFFRQFLSTLLSNPIIWLCVSSFVKLGRSIEFLKDYNQQQKIKQRIFKILPDPVVKHGPFKGMRYPYEFIATGSAAYPKLIGSYEKELHGWVEGLKPGTYSEIINVGCAEGYYAVGLALRNPNAQVYAYDTDERSQRYCKAIAELNGANNITVRATCTPETLKEFPFTKRGLIVCDCEGYEMTLFNKDNLTALKKCDILVEVHDMVNIEISGYLKNLFKDTHTITAIQSVDDIIKAKTYKYPETDNLDLETRKIIFAENRANIMDWFWIVANS